MAILSMNETTTFRWSFEEDVVRYAAEGIPAIGVQKPVGKSEAESLYVAQQHEKNLKDFPDFMFIQIFLQRLESLYLDHGIVFDHGFKQLHRQITSPFKISFRHFQRTLKASTAHPRNETRPFGRNLPSPDQCLFDVTLADHVETNPLAA